MLALAALLTACDPAPAESGAPSDTGDTAVGPGPDQLGGDTSVDTADSGDDGDQAAVDAAYAAFYDAGSVREIVVQLGGDALAAMEAEAAREYGTHPEDPALSYVVAGVVIDGAALPSVGLRFRSTAAQPTWDGKPGLRLKFDEFDGDRFAGLERASFDPMTNDPSLSRTVLGFHYWREAGMSAPQANFAAVYLVVDDAAPVYLGLYANVEVLDENWLGRAYARAEGTLWEAGDSADLTQRGLPHFELVTGPADYDGLDDARDAVQNHGSDFYADADEVLDMEQFLDFWTLSLTIGNRDGYPWRLDDYAVYQNPKDGRFRYTPTAMDEAWDSGTPRLGGYVNGTVAAFCLYYDATCPDRYLAALGENVSLYEAADLAAYASELHALTDAAVAADTRMSWEGAPLTPGEVSRQRATLVSRVELYPTWLRARYGLE